MNGSIMFREKGFRQFSMFTYSVSESLGVGFWPRIKVIFADSFCKVWSVLRLRAEHDEWNPHPQNAFLVHHRRFFSIKVDIKKGGFLKTTLIVFSISQCSVIHVVLVCSFVFTWYTRFMSRSTRYFGFLSIWNILM